jgi:DNA-binding NtrC family response regulator
MKTIDEKISNLIRKKLEQGGHSQVDLANHLGMSRQGLHYKLTAHDWDVVTTENVAMFFQTTLSEFILEAEK